jgi:hypothetical protein
LIQAALEHTDPMALDPRIRDAREFLYDMPLYAAAFLAFENLPFCLYTGRMGTRATSSAEP